MPLRELWVGTYTADAGRDGVGIGALRFEAVPGEHPQPEAEWLGCAVDAPSPSFVAVHPTLPIVYAVAETAQTVAAYRRVDAAPAAGGSADARPAGEPRLEPFGEPWPAGAAVCHVAVDPAGRFVTAACWGDGRVVLYELDLSGAIVSRWVGAAAADPHAASEQGAGGGEVRSVVETTEAMLARTGFAPRTSRAHCSVVLDDGRIMTTDLGFDLVRVWNYVPDRGLELDHEIVLPFWSGPRHLTAHPSGSIMIVTEYSVEVVVLERSTDTAAGAAGSRQAHSATPAASASSLQGDFAGPAGSESISAPLATAPSGLPRFVVTQCSPATARGARPFDGGAEIALADDARFAYVSVRGSNTLATLAVDARGHVRPVADQPSGGDWPRHHVVLGQTLLVANERSSQVTVFALDPESGLPSGPMQELSVEAPTALIPA